MVSPNAKLSEEMIIVVLFWSHVTISCIHYLTSKLISFDQALLEDRKKASNEVITNSHVLVGVMMELEKLFLEAHTLLKRVTTMAVQMTSDNIVCTHNFVVEVKEYHTGILARLL